MVQTRIFNRSPTALQCQYIAVLFNLILLSRKYLVVRCSIFKHSISLLFFALHCIPADFEILLASRKHFFISFLCIRSHFPFKHSCLPTFDNACITRSSHYTTTNSVLWVMESTVHMLNWNILHARRIMQESTQLSESVRLLAAVRPPCLSVLIPFVV